jgi:site-specific recombinase XerD
MKTIREAIKDYLNTVKLARSENTLLAYRTALDNLVITLKDNKIDIENDTVEGINEEIISWFAQDLKSYAATTEQLYITAVKGFLEYLVAEELSVVNLSKVKLLIRQRTRRPGKRLPQFPAQSIGDILEKMESKVIGPTDDKNSQLRAMRDKAFIITLGDTGLRVHEACNLKRGDIDWNEGKALIIGKGNRQAIVRFSRRSQKALKEYIQARGELDGKSGKSLGALPLFARHDKGAGFKVKPITTTTGRTIVEDIVKDVLGEEAVGTITPHSFRHYFVTRVLSATGNLKLAQNLARHQNIAVTQRYAHLSDDELDKGYWEVFED